MIIFIRDRYNRTIVDCEVYPVKSQPEYRNSKGHVELHSVVNIETYTDLFLENIKYEKVLKSIFGELQNLRGWLWEWYLPNNNTVDKYEDVLREIRKIFVGFAHQINDLCDAGVVVVED